MGKEDFGNIYVENSPQAYVQRLVPVDYGHYHDRYCEMINEELEKFAPKDRGMSAVELGSSYGNTTLAYKFGLNWERAVESWMQDDKPLQKKWDLNVVAVDISENALSYGSRRGIFDSCIVHDFANPPSNELAMAIENADFMTSIMTLFYIPTERWLEACYKFIANSESLPLVCWTAVSI
eukprot:764861-Hanusia_phi.AAC.7